MSIFKGTYIFNSGKSGWSESWYVDATSVSIAIDKFVEHVPSARAALTGTGVQLEAVRISEEGVSGDGVLKVLSPQPTPYAAQCDTPWNAILCQATGGVKYRRPVWLRGVPDSWIDRDQTSGTFKFPLAFTNNLTDYLVAIKNAGFKIRAYTKEGSASVGFAVTNMATAGGGKTILTVSGFTGKAGEKCGMKKWKGPDAKVLNKTFNVITVTDDNVIIDLDYDLLSQPASDVAGKLYPKSISYQDVTFMVPVRCASRRTGRAFFVSPGRRPSKR